MRGAERERLSGAASATRLHIPLYHDALYYVTSHYVLCWRPPHCSALGVGPAQQKTCGSAVLFLFLCCELPCARARARARRCGRREEVRGAVYGAFV